MTIYEAKQLFARCETLDKARALYHSLAMRHHPDKGGNTETMQHIVAAFHEYRPSKLKYDNELNDWNSREYAHIIEQLIYMPVEIEVCGSWIWITSEKKYKDVIKAVQTGESYKRGFSRNKVKWYFSPKTYRKKSKKVLSFARIQALYGSQKINTEERQSIAM